MRYSILAAGALAGLASAQTHTLCNPTEKDCPNDPAMPKNFETDFTKGADAVKGWKQTAGSLTYAPDGAQFTINKQGDAPTIQSEGYVFFGYIETTVKAASGQGIVSSIVLQSEDLDEVDWEFLGTTTTNVQMNYFGKGNTTTYDRMIPGPVSDPQASYHTYALNWTSESLTWLIDGAPVRTLAYADAVGGKNYPQTPATVRIGIWAGGDPTNEPGVIEWAGGKTDYTKAPFSMGLQSVKVINYNPGTEYKWTDKTGSFESIEVVGKGDEQGAPQNTLVIAPTATPGAPGGAINQSQIDVPTNTGGVFAPSATGPDGEPCDCGVATVTVTSATASGAAPPFPTGGLITDTAPPPAVPAPTGSVPGVPAAGNGTSASPSPSPFTGGAAVPTRAAGAVFGLVAGAAAVLVL